MKTSAKNRLIKMKAGVRGILIFMTASCMIFFSSCNLKKESQKFEIHRGVNLSHWLSQDFGWVPKYTLINEQDIKFIDSIGYDHVRIPIDEKEMWNEKGEQIPEAFEHLIVCLDWCKKYELRAIVDLHIIRSHHFNAENEGGSNTLWEDPKMQDRLINIWIELSELLHEYPNNMLAYEILNEVVAPKNEDWNKLLNRAISAIRQKEPERILIVGPNKWQIASNLQYLELPENDTNLILSFHTYTPLAFTHYQANWTPVGLYKGPVNYPEQIISEENFNSYVDTTNKAMVDGLSDARENFNKQRLIEVFQSGIDYARSKNLQLYCGEFGCLPTVEREDRLQYYKDMVDALEENNIAWCNWEYKGDFGIYHFDREKTISLAPDTELIEILLQRKP
jgi:endoglucanase